MRLFIAVNLPAHERESLYQATQPLRSAGFPLRFTAPESLHLTLKFLGQVEAPESERIGVALAEAVQGVRAFDLGIGGFGVFPDDPGHPRVIWTGVERHPALELLANDVQVMASRHGFEPELRPFAPHITIARVAKDARATALADLASVLAGLSFETMIPVESVDLMQSAPGRGGSKYTVVRAASLVTSGD